MAQLQQFTNNATGALNVGIGTSDTVLMLQGQGDLFPVITGSEYFIVTIKFPDSNRGEIVKVTARSGDTFTIVRAQEGTVASNHAPGAVVELRPTAGAFDTLYQYVDDLEVAVDATYFKKIGGTISGDTEFTSTGAIKVPAGTTAQRPIGTEGKIRFNTDLDQFEGFNGTAWTAVGGGATGGIGNYVFYENDIHVTEDYTITTGKNAMSAGPITIDGGVTVTVPTGSVWSVV